MVTYTCYYQQIIGSPQPHFQLNLFSIKLYFLKIHREHLTRLQQLASQTVPTCSSLLVDQLDKGDVDVGVCVFSGFFIPYVLHFQSATNTNASHMYVFIHIYIFTTFFATFFYISNFTYYGMCFYNAFLHMVCVFTTHFYICYVFLQRFLATV